MGVFHLETVLLEPNKICICYQASKLLKLISMNQIAILISPLIVMMFVSSITPGPNNLMLMLAGTQFGFVRTLPHLAGVTTGSALVICLTFLGLGTLMLGHPRVVDAMTLACGLYLVWLATRLVRPAPAASSTLQGRPPAAARPVRMVEAVAFQFVNPKVWTMAVAASSIAARFPFAPQATLGVIASIVLVVNTPCVALWAAFGKILRRQLEDPGIKRVFDVSMASLVIGTAAWIVWPVLFKSSI